MNLTESGFIWDESGSLGIRYKGSRHIAEIWQNIYQAQLSWRRAVYIFLCKRSIGNLSIRFKAPCFNSCKLVHKLVSRYWSLSSRLKEDNDFSRFPKVFTPHKFMKRQSHPDRVTQQISTQSPYSWRVDDGMCQHIMHVDVVFQSQLSAIYLSILQCEGIRMMTGFA